MISAKTLVSIVVPVYNQERYVGSTIESILSQTWDNIECIVVDDGSTDSTPAILKDFGSKIRVISQQNRGQAAAQNVGFQEAKGVLVGYLGSDDLFDPDLVEELLRAYDASEERPLVVLPDYRSIDEFGSVIRSRHNAFSGLDVMVKNFRCDIGPGALFSRTILETVGGWKADYRQMPDFEFWLRVGKISAFAYVPKVLASWRIHVGSQTASRSSCAKADEPARLIMDVRREPELYAIGNDRRCFEANGLVLAACLHLRAGRFFNGLEYLGRAVAIAPMQMFSRSTMGRIATSAIGFLRSRCAN